MQHKTTKDGTIGVLSRCVDFESISPTQGAMHQGAWIAVHIPNPRDHNVCCLSVVFTV